MYATSGAFFAVPALALAAGAAATGVWTTPHDKYSSSIGVLGCKINTNRVAYWPGSVDCDNICVKVSYEGRSVHLLRIDQSGGAHDISYDAWNYLQTGKSDAAGPISGGGVAMEYEEVPASECAHLIRTKGSKLPLSASNSMNFLTSCLAQPNSWVAKNHVLYNICDAICTLGHDEECSLDLSVSNQPSCGHTLGLTSTLSSAPVYDVEYQSGKLLSAGSGAPAPAGAEYPSEPEEEGGAIATTTAQATTTSVPEPAPTSAIFLEKSSSSSTSCTTTATSSLTTTSVQSPTAPVSTASPTSYPVAPTSTPSSASTEASSTTAKASSSTAAPATTASTSWSAPYRPVTSSFSQPTTLSFTTSGTAASTGSSSGSSSSSSSPSGSPSGSPSSTPSAPPVSAAHPGAAVPVLALVSSIFACSILSML